MSTALAAAWGSGPESILEFTVRLHAYATGRIFLVEYFWDHAEALEAAGLSE